MNQSSGSSVQTEITEIFPPENTKNIRLYTKYAKRHTIGIMVFYFVVGTDLESAFEVEAHAGMSISNLREVIYEKNKTDFENKKFDANRLNLWKVDIPGDKKNVTENTSKQI